MKKLSDYSKFIPYFYFIIVTAFVFTNINKTEGITAYPVLLFSIPFLWQILKPNKKLNFVLGVSFVCLSSYVILAYLFNILNVLSFSYSINDFMIFGGIFVLLNFVMALWILRNSINRSF